MSRLNRILLSLVVLFGFSSCGLQSIPQSKNNVDASLAEIANQYKRRSDLIPNIVGTVKGYAKHEEDTLEAVTNARAKATQSVIDPSKVTPQQLAEFQKAQGQLSQAIGRLLSIQETYPDLKADKNFMALQVELEGTENRITIARRRYIESIQEFNNLVSVPPTSWTNGIMYHFEKMPQWDVSADEKGKVEKAPEVKF